MKNLSLALMVLTTLSINVTSAQAFNKQVKTSVNSELNSQEYKLTNSTNIMCYWLPDGIRVCK